MAASLPLVTVIIATYNRPDVLRVAIESVIRQTFKDWRLLVIGDGCSEPTIGVVDEFSSDSRVFFANLRCRCGEQALPNSAGMCIADTEFVAFLNHDDIWLPDHLELAIKRLTSTEADFFAGRAAFAFEVKDIPGGGGQPVFSQETPCRRTLWESFSRGFMIFEPASSWVIRTSLARRTGGWRSSADLYRVPIQDWVMRAWRAGAVLTSDRRISCLKLETHWGAASTEQGYDTIAAGHAFLSRLLGDKVPDEVRRIIEAQIAASGSKKWARLDHLLPSKRKTARRLERLLHVPLIAAIYLHFGMDAYTLLCRIMRIPKGVFWKSGLSRRTGENLSSVPALQTVVKELEDHLALNQRWQSK